MAKTVRGKRTGVKKAPVEEKVLEAAPVKRNSRFPTKLFVYSLAILVVGAIIFFAGKTFFAASVNGQLVSRMEVIKELEKQGGKKTLDVIILKMVIEQEARKRKIEVSQKELDGELSKIEKNVESQGMTLDALLAQQGMTKDNLKDEIRLQLLLTKMIGNDVTVTDKEVTDYLATMQEQAATDPSLTPTPTPSKEQVKEQLKQKKLQDKVQELVTELRSKAKITYFVNY